MKIFESHTDIVDTLDTRDLFPSEEHALLDPKLPVVQWRDLSVCPDAEARFALCLRRGINENLVLQPNLQIKLPQHLLNHITQEDLRMASVFVKNPNNEAKLEDLLGKRNALVFLPSRGLFVASYHTKLLGRPYIQIRRPVIKLNSEKYGSGNDRIYLEIVKGINSILES